MESAGLVVDLALSRPATLGGGRLVCIDGPAGSGKTTLAAAIAARAGDARVVHMDDLYDGWSGLPRLTRQLDRLLRPLADGGSGSYRRYDWATDRFAETVTVSPTPLLVLEGVGSGSSAHAALVTVLVWVSAPADLRLERGLARDGTALEDRWRQWMRDESDLFRHEGTADRADVRVDGTGIDAARLQ